MSGLTPIQMADNLAGEIEFSGAALCTLGDVLVAVDEERLKGDYNLAGIGYLLQIIGTATLQNANDLQKHLAAVPATSGSTNVPPG